jgi:hypothetical protein
VIDTIDLQETRETITSQHSPRSGKEAQVQGLQKLLRPQGTLGLFIRNPPVVTPAGRSGPTSLLYPRLSREGLGARFLGLMADLDGKPEGDNSTCQESNGRAQAYGAARCGTRVIWLKLDCLNPDLQQVEMSTGRKGA